MHMKMLFKTYCKHIYSAYEGREETNQIYMYIKHAV